MPNELQITVVELSGLLETHRKGIRNTGLVLIALGALAILLPWAAALAIDLLLGWLLLAGGVALGIQSFRVRVARFWWQLGIGVLYGLAGLLLILHPLQGVITLTVLLALVLLVEGIAKVALALPLRGVRGWLWLLVSGLLALALSALILSGLPGTAGWALGLLLGINLVFTGFSLVSVAAAAR